MVFERFRQKKESSETEEDRLKKHDELGRQVVELASRSESLSPDQIIKELENIHGSSEIALWPERGGSFYHILKQIGDSKPGKGEVSRLLDMLAWPEFTKFQDRGNAQKILRIAGQSPSQEFLPILESHLDWLEKIKLQFKSQSEITSMESGQSMAAHEIGGYTPVPYGADESRFQNGIEEEIRLTKDLITACK